MRSGLRGDSWAAVSQGSGTISHSFTMSSEHEETLQTLRKPWLFSVSNLSDAERSLALERFQMIRDFFEDQMPLPEVARSAGVSLRAARYWVKRKTLETCEVGLEKGAEARWQQ